MKESLSEKLARIRQWISRLWRTAPWLLIAIGILAAGFFVDGLASGYIWRTLGALAKVSLFAALGLVASRKLTKLDLSAIEDEHNRCLAGLSQAIVISACVIGGSMAL